MLGGLLFRLFRILELILLIPIIGMLSYFVNGYVIQNQLTPTYILIEFIISVLAGAWALVTLFKMDSVRRNAAFVALVDVLFVGAFIGAVYELRYITQWDCSNENGGFTASGGASTPGDGQLVLSWPNINFTPWNITYDKSCAMLKACFALGIICILLFANTAFLASIIHRKERTVVVEKTYTSRRSGSHSSRYVFCFLVFENRW